MEVHSRCWEGLSRMMSDRVQQTDSNIIMQTFATTTDLKNYHSRLNEEDEDQQGFAEVEAESHIIPKHQTHDDMIMPRKARPKVLYRQPKLKLTFVGKEKDTREELRKAIISKEERKHGRSLDIHKKDSKKELANQLLADCMTKIKRTAVAENISIPTFSLTDSKAVKSYILSSGIPLVYEQPKEINTHGFIRNLGNFNDSFIEHKLNHLLQIKLKDSFIMPKKARNCNQQQPVTFQGEYQNGNLQFVSEVAPGQFELYLRNDTNTHGHQSWFNFRVTNHEQTQKNLVLNVCNLKRNLTMFADGAKVYVRKLNDKLCRGEWKQNQGNHQFKSSNNPKFTNVRVYRLTFQLLIEANTTIQVALLPAYTYSDLLSQIDRLHRCRHMSCSTLTYSLVGLAIPILTFTRGDNPHKTVILVSARIHPGETNASYMCRGLLRWLAQDTPQNRQFLERHIVKVIPMINPDGVLFGNFRTNFLGADLNRCFDSEDEITNPEISALKELGLKLKEEHGERFNLFLDLHGHSSERNIFTYGPDYELTETNYYQIRLLPKILNLRSKMFKYHSCTFKLEEYKRYTARGFFLNSIGILGYTVEAGYAFYNDENKLNLMGPKQWTQFGVNLGQALLVLSKINKLSTIRNKQQIKRALGQADKEQVDLIKKFKKQFKAQKEQGSKEQLKNKERGGEDSDGEGDCEDYTRAEKEEVLRRVAETMAPNLILPRVLKPAILYPTVTPRLFKYREEESDKELKIIYTKRLSRYSNLRMSGNSYIHALKGIEMLRQDKYLQI